MKNLIEKYEKRNKSRIETIKETDKEDFKNVLLNLYIETEEFIKDLKLCLR